MDFGRPAKQHVPSHSSSALPRRDVQKMHPSKQLSSSNTVSTIQYSPIVQPRSTASPIPSSSHSCSRLADPPPPSAAPHQCATSPLRTPPGPARLFGRGHTPSYINVIVGQLERKRKRAATHQIADSTAIGSRERAHSTRTTGPASVSASSSGVVGLPFPFAPDPAGSRMRSTESPRHPAAVRRRGARSAGRCACAE
jgi:hypothetical protein